MTKRDFAVTHSGPAASKEKNQSDSGASGQEAYGVSPGNLVKDTLSASVEATLSRYFEMLNGFESSGVYEMVMNEVEEPLLRVVLDYCDNNQSRAAEVLGLNRGTLRKKLKFHNLL
ncbi:MAG: hypothetical protein KDI30_13060 [Pseudomonadales bacterium]|nr:hypothetical protein [Pseudomonadales bacterium]